jgi:hypothetical protein
MTMAPDRQAKYAPEHGLGCQGPAYDRLRTEWQAAGRAVPGAAGRAVPGATRGGVVQHPRRSSPEARGAILESFRRLNGTLGGGAWTEQGQVVLQMAILETLLSIEEKLAAPHGQPYHP